MAGSLFIKSTAFGGYDKPETDKVIEDLFAQVYELKNQLRDSELFAASKKGGKDNESSAADAIAASAKELAKVQAENETLSRHVEELKAESAGKDEQIADLNAQIEKLQGELKEANNRLDKVENGEATMLSKVFIEAQKSADMVRAEADKQAEELKADSQKLSDNIITEANNKAAKIVYAAEKQAAEIEAKAYNDDEAMKAASSNLRAVMLSDIESISANVAKIKELFTALQTEGTDKLTKSEGVLKDAEAALKKDGVPKFTVPEEVAAQLPKEPTLGKTDYAYSSGKSKDDIERNEELEKLMSMAQSIASDDDKKNGKKEEKKDDKKKEEKSGGGLDLDALAKMAESLK